MVAVGYLPPEFDAPVPFDGPGGGVQVDHDLDGVAGAVVSRLGVDDDGVILSTGDDFRYAGEDRCPAVEFKRVLGLGVDGVTTEGPVGDALVEERGVVEHSLGLVEVRRDAFPALVMGLEPNGPLAGVLTGERARQPSCPDVCKGNLVALPRHGTVRKISRGSA